MSTEDTRNMSVNPEPEELSEDNLNELRKIRREKLKNLQDAGRNPFLLEKWDITAHSMDIKDNFDAMGRSGSIMRRKDNGFSATWEKPHL